MALITRLTWKEATTLFSYTLAGLQATDAELDHLTRMPPATRDLLYGSGLLDAYYGVRDDLADLLRETAAALYAAPSPERNHDGTETI